MTDSSVILDKRGQAYWITINRPDKRNALNGDVIAGITRGYREAHDDSEVRVIVLTGAGKTFSAGADIKSRGKIGAVPGDTYRHLRRAREVGFCIIESNKPVIAAVNGPALGAGLGLALCSDIILASENAVFGLPEIDVGLMGGVRHTMRLIPHSLARRWLINRRPRARIEASLEHVSVQGLRR